MNLKLRRLNATDSGKPVVWQARRAGAKFGFKVSREPIIESGIILLGERQSGADPVFQNS